jgi:hypothetical protein
LQARIAEREGALKDALQHIEHASTMQPANKEYLARKARLLQRLNRAEEAQAAYERSHELARAELDLWSLARDLGGRLPTVDECQQVASRYDTLQKPVQSAAWRRLGEQLRSVK